MQKITTKAFHRNAFLFSFENLSAITCPRLQNLSSDCIGGSCAIVIASTIPHLNWGCSHNIPEYYCTVNSDNINSAQFVVTHQIFFCLSNAVSSFAEYTNLLHPQKFRKFFSGWFCYSPKPVIYKSLRKL